MLSAKITGPFILVKGVSTTIACPIYSDAVLKVASSGTYSIVDSSFNVKASGSVTIASDIATVTLTTSLTIGDRYRIIFEITMADSSVVRPENELYVVRQSFYPVISGLDLYKRVPALNPASDSPHSSYTGYEDFIEEAWNVIQNKLISKGNRPALILSNTALREVHILLSLSMIFEDFATSLNAEWSLKAQVFQKAYEAAWDELAFRYEDDVSNTRRKSATPTFWLK